MDSKTLGIVSYLTLIGWVIALVMNQSNKDEHVSFHIRQYLMVMIFFLAASVVGMFLFFIPFLGLALWLMGLVLWIMGIIGAVKGEKKELPVVGALAQKWFKAL